MKRAFAWLAVVAVAGGASLAPAQEDAPDDALPPKLEPRALPEWGARPAQSYDMEWVVYSTDLEGGALHGMAGIGANIVPWMPVNPANMRFLRLYGAVLGGDLGSDQRGPFHLQTGITPTLDVCDLGAVDLFLGPRHLVTASFDFDGHVEGSTSHGLALGMRLLDGALSAQAWVDATFAFEGDFSRSGLTDDDDPWTPRAGLSLLTDVCFYTDDCSHPAPAMSVVDLTPILDAALARASKENGAPFETKLCDAAEEAASVRPDPKCGGNDAAAFLCRMDGFPPMKRVSAVHQLLSKCLQHNRDDGRELAKHKRQQKRRLQYAAYPPEMRRALSCEWGSPATPVDRDLLEDAKRACPAAATLLGR